MLRRGRHSEALRRYELVRRRYRRTFGTEPALDARRSVAARQLTRLARRASSPSPPRSRGGSSTSWAASRAGATRCSPCSWCRRALALAFVVDRRARRRADTEHDARATRWAVGGGSLGPARARRVLPRAVDRHDERRRADLGHRRGDPGARRPARRASGPARSSSRGSCSPAGGVVLAAREAPGEDEASRRAGRAVDRAGDRRGDRLRLVLRLGSTGPRRPPTSPGCCSSGAASTSGSCSRPARSRARTCRARRRRSARSPRSASSTCCANLLFVLATGRGLLSVVGVLGSLYPAVTVVLARVVLARAAARGRRAPGVRRHAGRRRRARRGLASGSAQLRPACAVPCPRCADSSPSSPCCSRCSPCPRAASAAPHQVMTFEAPGELLDDAAARARRSTRSSASASTASAQLVYWREFAAQPNSKQGAEASTPPTPPRTRRAPGTCSTGSSPRPRARHRAAADAHRAGAEVGDEAQEAATSTIRARSCSAAGSRAVVAPLRRPREPVVDLERAQPPGLPRAAVQARAGRTRRSSTASSTRPASRRSTARRATSATTCCSARPRRSATRTSSRRSPSCAGRCA